MSNYVKTPTIYQMESTECGAASLSMIFAYFGKHIPLEQMRIETGVSRDGCVAGNIMRCARKYKLECHGYRKEPEDLKTIQTPCIIHWNFNHFVVFEGFKGKYAYINDPANGRRKLTFEELDEAFTGVVMTFKPAEGFEKQKKETGLLDFMKKKLKGQYGLIFKLLFIGFLLVFPGLMLPVLSRVFIDDILVGGNTDWFNMLILFMIGSLTLKICLKLYRDRLLAKMQKKTVLLSAREFLYTLFRLPISFFDQRYAGDLVSRVKSSANVSSFLAGELAETVLNVLVAAFYLFLLIVYSPILTAAALVSVIIDLIIMKMSSTMLANASAKLQQDSGRLAGTVCAGISITSTLKASGAEPGYISRILGCNAKAVTLEQELNRDQQIINAFPGAVKMITDVLLLLIGSGLVIDGKMTVGMLVAFTAMFGMFSEPVDKLVGFAKNLHTTKADIDRIDDIMRYEKDSAFDETVQKKSMTLKLEGAVELENVSFGYSRLKPPLIVDLSFKIPVGRSIAVVGSSGCGKSTVSKLVSGLYKPWNGRVLFDGIPAENIPNEIINASISTVSQNTTLFSGSVRDNLTMWNENVSENDMIAAARDACIHDLISQKPGGYDFKLTEGASNLSGGQRQRLEIARALTTNPTVLIMDEATSALDPIIEKQIIDNIKRRGCTCVVVAHRLSAIRDCDQIIVISNGSIVQRGSHSDLAASDGPYSEFIKNL